jgi:hypothetical protein
MRTRNDLSRSFYLPGASGTYFQALAPDPQMMDDIHDAERRIRSWLGTEIPKRLASHLPPGAKAARPKFMKQGSAACDLLNDPLRDSENYAEADADLGAYLPVTTFKKCTEDPGFAAKLYLELVEQALRELAKKHGWTVTHKTCCIRVKVRTDAHLDVTCYVVPEAEFLVMKAAADTALGRRAADFAAADADFVDLTWDELPDQPLLATDDGWQRSNAKAVHNLVANAARLHGSEFKRNVRYVKGQRDFADDKLGPCSIAITVILAYRVDPLALVRDDLGVLAALGIVAEGLEKHVPTPGNEDVDILKGVSPEERSRLAARMRSAQAQVRSAIFDLDRKQAHDVLRQIFGQRFPSASNAPAEPAVSGAPTVMVKRVAPLAPAGNVRSA